MDAATKRYLKAIHFIKTGVSYTLGGERLYARKLYFFHTQGWGEHDLIAAIQERNPTWKNIDLVVPAFCTPAIDAVVPKRDPKLEAEIVESSE